MAALMEAHLLTIIWTRPSRWGLVVLLSSSLGHHLAAPWRLLNASGCMTCSMLGSFQLVSQSQGRSSCTCSGYVLLLEFLHKWHGQHAPGP